MLEPETHETHISRVLGQMVKKWTVSLPEGVRALEKFNRENGNVLLAKPEEKRKALDAMRLKNFKCSSTGQRIDLSKYVPRGTAINEGASH